MKFDNAQFQQGAATTLSTLDKLKQSMNFTSTSSAATKGLGAIQTVLGKFGIKNPFAATQQGLTDAQKAAQGLAGPQGIGSIEGGITGISSKFVAMSTIAITALSNIANKAINAGTTIVKSLTVDPLTGGLEEYETNLNSIQTILANTKVSGAGLKDVNAALDELNAYSDKTIYNFSQMAKNIGTFTAAGVDLDTATSSIKGIANLAALSGSSSEQASNAMYQLSQEIAAGRVSLMGWNSVVNAGMGGSTFQRALVQTAQEMGDLEGKTVKFTGKMKNATIDGKSFRDSIMAKPGEQSWLSSKVLTKTLEQFTGDMTDAELAAQGFSKAQIKAIQSQAKTAVDAATKVKTLSGVLDTAKEVAGSGWAKTWQIIFGDFKEARTLFTNVSNSVNGFLGSISDARNNLLQGWKDAGGRTKLIAGLGEVFSSLGDIFRTVADAWRSVFPAASVDTLMQITDAIGNFGKALKPSAETAENLQRTFAGVFAVLHIGWTILKNVVGTLFDLVGVAGSGSGGILAFTASIGDFLVNLDKAISSGKGLGAVFDVLGAVLSVPIRLLQGLGALLAGIFDSFDGGAAGKATDQVEKFGDALSPLEKIGQRLEDIFGGVGQMLGTFGEKIGEALSSIGGAIADSFMSGDYSPVFDALNTGLLAGIVLLIRKFMKDGLSLNLGVGGSEGLFGGITKTFGELTGTLQAMQTNIKASALLKIAGAVAILAASMVVLSLINSKDLTKALAAMAAGFGMLIGSMVAIEQLTGFFGGVKFAIISGGFIALAAAILILSASVKVLSTMSWEELAKGLGGVAVLLASVSAASIPLSANAGGMIRAGAGIAAMAVGIAILAGAVKIMATMSWEEMGKGLLGLAGLLVMVAAAANLLPASLVLTGPGLVAFAGGVAILAGALKIMGSMSMEEIGKGLLILAGALAIIAAAVYLIPPSIVLIGPGLLVVAAALVVMSGALKVMGSMSWEEIGKSMVVLFGALALLALGLTAMIAALPGAAALVVAAAALAVLTPVLLTLGAMSWESILTGLAALAGLFVVLGVAAFLLQPVIPALLGLGVALVLLGAGIALAGAGIFLIATAISMLAVAWSAGNAIILGAISQLLGKLPEVGTAIVAMLVAMADAITKNAPKFQAAFVAVLTQMLNAVIKVVPKIGRVMTVLINTALGVIEKAVPRYVTAGLRILIGILTGIGNNIGRVVTTATTVVVNFLNAVGKNSGRIAEAGVQMIIDFINGITRAINNNTSDIREAGVDLAMALVNGMTGGLLGAGVNLVENAAAELAEHIPGPVKKLLGIGGPSRVMCEFGKNVGEGLAGGIDDSGRLVASSTEALTVLAIDKMRTAMGEISDTMALDPNMNPTVTPVLDLTQLTQEANKMNGILANPAVDASVSYARAVDISTETQASQEQAWEMAMAASQPKDVKIEQNNYSPKAIDSVTQYRQTKNLFALTKEALDA
jgi:tape measure domain-containing protein